MDDGSDQKMPAYIGTKIVCATPMKEGFARARIKNCEVAEAAKGSPDGYLVCYEDGYLSWSPKEVFERCYRLLTENEKKLM
ncbi:MAG: hypothetical protein ABIG61_12065 [Planctomycetota bacterium]